MPARHPRRPFTRTALTAAAALVTVVAASVVTSPAASGQEAEEFILGSGRSEARLVRVGPSAGQLSLAPVIGIALTDYLNKLGRAESRIADYAALESSLPPELLDGAPPVKVTSTDEGSAEGSEATTAGTPEGSPTTVGGMRQSARATDQPEAEAIFQLGAFDVVPGAIEVGGGTARSTAAIVDGATRQATGTTTFGSVTLGGGAVVLQGLRWEAVQRTGAEEAAGGGFSIEGITVAGQALPVPKGADEVATAFEQVNAALAPLGLQVFPPVVSTEAGVARISPLTIKAGDSEVGNTVLGPAIGALQPVRQPVADALLGISGEFATALLLADVTTGVVSGGSTFEVQLGGASAFTEGTAFDDPFGEFELGGGGGGFDLGGGPSAPAAPGTAGGAGPGAVIAGTPGTPGRPATPGTPGTPASAGEAVTAPDAGTGGGGTGSGFAAQLAGTSIPGSRGGVAALVGLFGLLAALGMAAADWQRLRGGARVIPEA